MTSQTPTLTELWDSFRQERSIAVAPTSMATDYRQVGSWLARCPHQHPEAARQAMVWVLQQQPEKAARRVGKYLKCLFRWAASEDVALVERNPVATFRLPKRAQREVEVTTIPASVIPEVLWALECRSTGNPKWHLLADFMLQTGVRTAEAFGLQWGDVDFDGQRCLIHQNMTLTHGLQNRTKTGEARWVPLNEKAVKILWNLKGRDPSPQCFPWNRQTFMSAFKRAMQQLLEEGTIARRYRPYDLRHTHISALLEKGIPVAQVARWAGNTPETIWAHYAGVHSLYEMPTI